MCVNHVRSSLLSRSGFIGGVAAAAIPLMAAANGESSFVLDLKVPDGLTAANGRAARIAASSPLVKRYYAFVCEALRSISDPTIRDDVSDLLQKPVPKYAARYSTVQSREALRDALVRNGFLASSVGIEAIFPPVGSAGIAQPFWSAPGSETNGHHSYPGGLMAHELFNANMGLSYAQMYDRQYFDTRRAVDSDLTIAAALYHDIMKTVVFQYNDDGTFFEEASLGDTGAHHCLSGAEAIARGRDAKFVTILLSAHAAPSLGDERKVVTWCRVAAQIAGVDPVEFGLLKKTADGFALAQLPPPEAFVCHLSDHDYVLAIPAAQLVREKLADIATRFGVSASDTSALNWWRLNVSSRASDIALYSVLCDGGDAAFYRAVNAAVACRTLRA